MNRIKMLLILITIALIPSLIHLGCGGGDGDGGGQNGETTQINGRISNVVAMTESNDKSIKYSKIMDMLSLIKEAKAQDGIMVTAIIDGVAVDTDTTEPDGSFTLSFLLESAENVTFLFDINGTEVSISILVQEGSIIEIVVAIDLNEPPGDEVEVVDLAEAVGPVRCENGTLEITKEFDEDIIIDGGGEDCIRTAGNCELIIDPEDIVLTNCQRCVDARGTSSVTLQTFDGDIYCDAFKDGFRSRGDAEIIIDAIGNIDILANDNGARADGNSTISFFADACIFDTGEETFDEQGNALIDPEGCGEIIRGPVPTASPFPSPFPSPEPTPEF